jgi:outer membrane autotransporter protein
MHTSGIYSSSIIRASVANRIIDGGRKIIYTVATAAMLNANLTPNLYAAFTSNVSSGTTVTGETVDSGSQMVYDGGRANSGTIISSGNQYIYSSGIANITYIFSGGKQYISNGGSALSTTINSGGSQFVSSGGSALSTTINSGGEQHVSSGGSASGVILNSGGSSIISSGGKAYSIVQSIGGAITTNVYGGDSNTVVSGSNVSGYFSLISGVANNFILYSGASQNIFSGGSANSTTISGGIQNISNGGFVLSTTINSGGKQYVYNGGSASGVILNSGGSNIIYSGGVASATNISSGGVQHISNGGIVYFTTINSGGNQHVSSGGIASSTNISSGGNQHISSGGSANYTVISSGGSSIIYSGGKATNIDHKVGGAITTNVYGGDNSTIVSGSSVSGSSFSLSNGVAKNFILYSGASQNIFNGGIANNTIISGGSQNISSGGLALATTVLGGEQNIYDGGSANSTTISGGSQNILSGAIASATTILGGEQNIYDGGSAEGSILNGGVQNIHSGGSTISSIISGGDQNLSYGAVADGTIVKSNGYQVVSSGAYASNTQISRGGEQYIFSGGSASDTIINLRGYQHVFYGGLVSGTLLSGGNQFVLSGASAIDTIISGGNQYVSAGGAVNSTTINSGGSQFIYSGGKVTSTIINSGGGQYIQGGGSSYDATASAGGAIFVESDGVLGGDIKIDGGLLHGEVMSQGVLANINISNGGIWANMGDSFASTLNIDNGYLDLRNAQPGVYSILRADSISVGSNGAVISMNAELGDDSSNADLIVVNSSYDGDTLIKLTNTGGNGALTIGDGIKLVDLNENGTNSGSFALAGGKADAGAYEYELYEGGIGTLHAADYFLRSTERKTDIFKTMANIPEINMLMARAGMNNLEKRLGDLRGFNNTDNVQGIWARTYAKKMTVEDLLKTDMTIFGVEAGYDYLFTPEEPNKLYAGVMIGYMYNGSIKTAQDNGSYGSGNGLSPSVGIYATLINERGWFVDIAARNFWTRLDMTSYDVMGTALKYSPKRNIFAGSLEAGKDFKGEIKAGDFIKITPKAELTYMRAGADETEVQNGTGKMEIGASTSIAGRAAILIGYNTTNKANGLLIEPLIELAYSREFSGKNEIKYGAGKYESDLSGGMFEAALGLNSKLSKDVYVFGQITYEKGGKVEAYGGNVGIKYAFGNMAFDPFRKK